MQFPPSQTTEGAQLRSCPHRPTELRPQDWVTRATKSSEIVASRLVETVSWRGGRIVKSPSKQGKERSGRAAKQGLRHQLVTARGAGEAEIGLRRELAALAARGSIWQLCTGWTKSA
jgi:hypothetical protein